MAKKTHITLNTKWVLRGVGLLLLLITLLLFLFAQLLVVSVCLTGVVCFLAADFAGD